MVCNSESEYHPTTMYTVDNFLRSIRHETEILKHLHGKLSAEQLDYRPAEGMRSTLELLRYLSYCGIATAEALAEGSWTKYHTRVAAAEKLEGGDFSEAADRQLGELEDLVRGLSEEDLRREVESPSGQVGPLGAILVNHPLRYLSVYRMQLYVYAKASGCSGLSTWNAWGGRDQPEEAS